jgi:peroxiredoxin
MKRGLFAEVFMGRWLVGVLLAAAVPAFAAPVAVGDILVPFSLKNYDGRDVSLSSYNGKKAVVLIFMATQCPVSNSYNSRMVALSTEYSPKGVAFVGLNANKQESVAEIAEHAKAHGFAFPILKDDGNVQADAFGAQVTPEAYVYDGAWKLRYHGRIDDDMRGTAIKSQDLRNALEAVLAGRDVPVAETKAFGCSIKRIAR